MEGILNNPLILFILGLAILIFIHEMGHFIAAKLTGVGVEEFGIGFPPRIVTLFEAMGTKFSLNWIPLGGFVRLAGENDPEVEGGFSAARPWVRLTVLAAGPFANIVSGLILGILFVYSFGQEVPGIVQVRGLVEGAPAELAGIQSEDRILSIAGVPVSSTENAIQEIEKHPEEEIVILVERAGVETPIVIVPRAEVVEDSDGNQVTVGKIGAMIGSGREPVPISTAIVGGTQEFTTIIRFIATFPVQLINGEVSAEESRFVGYRGMYEIYRATNSPLWFFMMISIMLGLFNLLPIPALDGGRIALILPEIFLRKRVPARYENMIHLVGFIVLILFMVYVNIQDWINPIVLPR